MFTRPQNNGFIGPSGMAKRRGISYIDADFHPTPAQVVVGASVAGITSTVGVLGGSAIVGNAPMTVTQVNNANNGGP